MYYRTAGISFYTRRLVQALAALPEAGQTFTLSVLMDRRDADVAWLPASVNVIRTVTPAHHKLEAYTLPIELAISNDHVWQEVCNHLGWKFVPTV